MQAVDPAESVKGNPKPVGYSKEFFPSKTKLLVAEIDSYQYKQRQNNLSKRCILLRQKITRHTTVGAPKFHDPKQLDIEKMKTFRIQITAETHCINTGLWTPDYQGQCCSYRRIILILLRLPPYKQTPVNTDNRNFSVIRSDALSLALVSLANG